jgi:hypothetical protein
MPRCPSCHDEFEPGVVRCPDCDVDLVPDGTPLPPRVDAVLGRFHPRMAPMLQALLERRGIAHERHDLSADGRTHVAAPGADADTTARTEDGAEPEPEAVELVVDRLHRDDLRAELTVNWSGLVAALEPEDRERVRTSGGAQPGWFDAPTEAWVDRHGRLQVGRPDHEQLAEDASRTLGPAMALIGAILLLFGWFVGSSELSVLAGLALLVVGLLLPR